MNITYDKNRRRNAIEIVLTVTEWAGGEDDPLHLVRNEDGEWGHVVHSFIDAKRDAFDDDPDEPDIDHDDGVWFCDEDTARRALHSHAMEAECDECGLTAFSREMRRSGEDRLCRVCKPPRAVKNEPKPAEPESLPLFPEGN